MMNNNSFTYAPQILSYTQYRYVCDYCDWDSGNHERLSQAAKALSTHKGAHDPKPKPKPAPIKPSQVLDNVRKIR